MNEPLPYSMLIEYSDEDQAYLVTLPEWAATVIQPVTHGATYAEAAARGQEVLELFLESDQQEGLPLPAPRKHAVDTRQSDALC